MKPIVLSVRAGLTRPQQEINYPRQSGGRSDSSTVRPDSARQDVCKSDSPKQTGTPPDRTAGGLGSATAGQYSAGKDSNRPDSTVTGNQNSSQGVNSPDSDAVGVPDGRNLYLRCKFKLKPES